MFGILVEIVVFYVIYILVVEKEDNEDIWKIFGVLIMLVRVEDSVVEKIFVKIRGLNVEVILIVYKWKFSVYVYIWLLIGNYSEM